MSPGGRFRFSLETVLRVRSLREEQARTELARAIQQLERSRLSLREIEARWRSLLAELRDCSAREWTSLDYQRFKEYLNHLKAAIIGWQERITQEEAAVEQHKLRLQQLYQERRLLEKLREKKFRQYQREVMKIWEKETEGLTLGRWSEK